MKSTVITILTILITGIIQGQVVGEKSYLYTPCSVPADKASESTEPMYNALEDNYDVTFYKLDLQADNASTYLIGNVTILAAVVAPALDTFVVELNTDYSIDSIVINGNNLPFIRHDDDVKIQVQPELTDGSDIEAVIYYRGSLPVISQGFFTGISTDLYYDVTYTLSEPLYAKDWFPCKQVLTDKADSVYVFITTDSTLKAGSNGLLTNTVPLGNGKVRYEWKSKYPIDYYLISMTIGNFVEYDVYAYPEGISDSILIQNYLYDSTYLDYYKPELDQAPAIMEAYCNMFGMYPFKDEKYGHCMAPIGGGMEHQTMTTISAFSFELIAHEMAHMWFGDYVTCGTWQDIWINEGFATYSHLLALEYINGSFPTSYMISYINDQIAFVTEGSVFIPQTYFDIDYSVSNAVNNLSYRIFDWGLSYEKGAILLHMLRYELQNDEMFFNILRSYLSQYKFSTAIGNDFKSVAETVSGEDLTYFFNQWYYGEGYPRYKISWFQEGDTVFIRSRQGKSTINAPFFKMHLDFELSIGGGSTIVRKEQTQADQVFKVPVTGTVTFLNADPDHWVLADFESITNEHFNALYQLSLPVEFQVFPNPFKDWMTVSFNTNTEPVSISVFDAMGNCLRMQANCKRQATFDTDGLPAGIYFIRIENKEGSWNRKVIKN